MELFYDDRKIKASTVGWVSSAILLTEAIANQLGLSNVIGVIGMFITSIWGFANDRTS